MSIFKKRNPIKCANDAILVMSSLGGDRHAFCEIVTRYQNLLCSLAYSAVGDIKHSEDIAQEVFVEAWKKLDTLLDPEKLKSWLCGILRFKVSHYRRKEQRQPIKDAQELDESDVNQSSYEKMEDVAIREQEQSLLWKALDNMDDIYREPLILFYREQNSVEHVALELDLTEDTIKQRLSRGRKLLQKSMLKFVEETLVKSKPGLGFTAGVLTAISSIAPPAKAAALGAGAVKTGSLFKLATVLTSLAAFSGVISTFFGLRASLDQSRTQRERIQAIKIVALFMFFAVVFVAGMFALKIVALSDNGNVEIYAVAAQLLVLAYVASNLILVAGMFKSMRKLRSQERLFHSEAFLSQADQKDAKQREYKSRLRLFGIPFIHFQFGRPEVGDKLAFGWISGGNQAFGLLFAWGGVAVAPISVGIVSIGVVSLGALGFGLIGIGTVGIGVIGFGASAIAYKAYASLSALGWESAFSNGFSIAKDAAIGPIAQAAQVNNEQAYEISNLARLGQYHLWILAAIALVVIIPAIWHSHKVRQRMK
jgi:RNA polymerase sigma factor (sigma-70 family)